MACPHCGFACTAKGEDMSIETFKNYVKYCEAYDIGVEIGGGEPTVHPQFWDFIGIALCSSQKVWLCTNGKKTADVLKLIDLADLGRLSVLLSIDEYHDPIDEKVKHAFVSRELMNYNNIGTKRVNKMNLAKAGRQKIGSEHCFCNITILKPNGDLYGCSCDVAPCFGNINRTKPEKAPVREEREPLVDIMEEEDEIIVVAEIPGCVKENIELETTDNSLTIIACDEEDVRKYNTKP